MFLRIAVLAFTLFPISLVFARNYSTFPQLDFVPLRAEDSDVCTELSPQPSEVTDFYETNPTYVAPPLTDANLWPRGTPESTGMKSAPLLKGAKFLEGKTQLRSFLLLHHGTLVVEDYFHEGMENDSLNVHSASKTILGLLMGIAIHEGFIDGVEEKVGDLLSQKFTIPDNKSEITIQNLLNMSAGLKWTEDKTEYTIQTKPNWVQAILDLPVKAAPGAEFNYCTGLTHLTSAVLTEATGMSTCHFAKKYLFDPMSITFEHWGRDPQGYYSGGYNLYLKPRELLKIGQLILQNGSWQGKALVPSDWVTTSMTPTQTVDEVNQYGNLIWLLSVDNVPVYKMWGYGGQFVYIIPSKDLVMVLTADTRKYYEEMDADDFVSQYILPAF